MSAKTQRQVQSASTIEASSCLSRTSFLRRKCACGGNAGFTGECEECRSKSLSGETHPLIQPKLKISQPGDKYEQEADRIAEQVMRMPEPTVRRQVEPEEELLQAKPLANQITPLLQKQVDEEEEDEEELVQAKSNPGESAEVTPMVANRINALRGGGEPLDSATRAFFEPRFGHDFSQVRVHTNSRAAEMAQVVKARAFTVGRDVVFGAGEYASRKSDGRKLLAHELTHVVQQQDNTLARNTIFRAPKISTWAFKWTGSTSPDNCCGLCPAKLGKNVQGGGGDFQNGIEFKAFIRDYNPAYNYELRRTKTAKHWERVDGKWRLIHKTKRDADDGTRDADDGCLSTQMDPSEIPKDHPFIYSIDQPGLRPPYSPPTGLTDEVHVGHFTEFVSLGKGGTTIKDPFDLKWESVVWVKYSSLGAGRYKGTFDESKSDIGTEHLHSLDPPFANKA